MSKRLWAGRSLAWLTLMAILPTLASATPPVVLRIYSQAPGQAQPTLAASFDLEALRKLPQKSFSTQTPWYPQPVQFTGPLLRDVLATAKVKGKTLQAIALDEYKVSIPFADAQQFDVVLAHSINGQTLTPKDKGPLFVVYPYDSRPELQSVTYYLRSAWQLKALRVE